MSAGLPRAVPCLACRRRVVWARDLRSGGLAAIDAETHPEGRFRLWAEAGRWQFHRLSARALEREHPPLHRSHQQTCASAIFQKLRKIRRGDPAYAPLTSPLRPAHTAPAMRRPPSPQEELPL